MAHQFTEIPYPIEQILRDNCPALTPNLLAAKQKLVLRRPQEPAEALLVYTIVEVGPHLHRLMLDSQPPRIIDISTAGLGGLCRKTDLLVNRAVYENLVLAQSTADAAMQRFLCRPAN